MQKVIAFLLRKFTPFRVVAWDQGHIAGIGFYPGPHQTPTVEQLKEMIDALDETASQKAA